MYHVYRRAFNPMICAKNIIKLRQLCTINHFENLEKLVSGDSLEFSNIEKYTRDWTGNYSGGSCVIFPSCTSRLSSIMTYCNQNCISVVPQGGNTGNLKLSEANILSTQ